MAVAEENILCGGKCLHGVGGQRSDRLETLVSEIIKQPPLMLSVDGVSFCISVPSLLDKPVGPTVDLSARFLFLLRVHCLTVEGCILRAVCTI